MHSQTVFTENGKRTCAGWLAGCVPVVDNRPATQAVSLPLTGKLGWPDTAMSICTSYCHVDQSTKSGVLRLTEHFIPASINNHQSSFDQITVTTQNVKF